MCFLHNILALGLLVIAGSEDVKSGGALSAYGQLNTSFLEFKSAMGRAYAVGSSEHEMRESIFNQKIAEINAHNAMERSWKMGVNQFTDRSEDELRQMRGYRKTFGARTAPWQGGMSLIQLGGDGSQDDKACMSTQASCTESACCSGLICGSKGVCEKVGAFTETVDYSTLATSKSVPDQQSCGSCWAVAAVAAIQLGAAKSHPNFNTVLSPQSVLSCTPNKMECGGQGGCSGATPELGFEWVKRQGRTGGVLPLDQEKYTATTDGAKCDGTKKASFLQTNLRAPTIPAVSIGGWVKVEANSGSKVMEALVHAGPLAVAVVGSGIQSYSSGVIDSCHGNTVVDHAVTMVGYGTDPEQGKYWTIRNSWGPYWGEGGFFKLRRHADGAKGEEPCGYDMQPEVGVVCKDEHGNYPKSTWVCGECGIVSDVAYPVDIQVHPSLLTM